MQTYFHTLADYTTALAKAGEIILLWFSAEESDFVRFNKNAVRQAGSVKQAEIDITLIVGRRHTQISLSLSGHTDGDRAEIKAVVEKLRSNLPDLPEDPYLLYNTIPQSTEYIAQSSLPADEQIIDGVLRAGEGTDLVGFFASGPLCRGFANSLGQRNWHRADNFNFEWCLYHAADKAVKSSYADYIWNADTLARKMHFAKEQLALLSSPPLSLAPGAYRAYVAPAALNEIVSLLNWGGFGLKSHRTKQSPLQKMLESGLSLNPDINIRENIQTGAAPGFQQEGFIKTNVPLITKGKIDSPLVSPRSAREYDVATNGANAQESAESLDFAGGALAHNSILKTLDTGIFIGNLWYLNFSDRMACRMTGMTRFATFWVEKGQIKAPLNVMRFDDSAFRIFGENLLGLTQDCELILDSGTYGQRATTSARLPGVLVKDFLLTL